DPHGGDCRHDLSAGRHLDETDRSERYRCRRRLPARQVAHHPRSGRQRTVQWHLNIRHGLVNARTRTIAVARAITRGAGYRIAGGATETFVTRLAALDLPTAMRESLAPVHQVMEVLDEELAKADAHFAALTADDPVVKRLTTCPRIGPITAAAFVAALDDVRRFDGRRGAGQVTSYLGAGTARV